jgi:spore coat protein JB
MDQKNQLLYDIGIVDFVLVDLAQFLDTHPSDREALEYYHHYMRISNQMKREFSMKYFPLTKDLAEWTNQWKWGSAPLPWEGEC